MAEKKTRNLIPAPNASARMQELLRESASNPVAETEQNTGEEDKYARTQVRTQILMSPEENVETSGPVVEGNRRVMATSALQDTLVSASGSVQNPSSAPEGVFTPTPVVEAMTTATMATLHERVTERLSAKGGKEATVRLSVDVSQSMHERIKRYCADNRIPSTRALVVELLDSLLSEAGY